MGLSVGVTRPVSGAAAQVPTSCLPSTRGVSIMVSSPLPPVRRAVPAGISSRPGPRTRSTALILGGAVMVLAAACPSGGPVGVAGMHPVRAASAATVDGEATVRLVARVTPLVTVTSGSGRLASSTDSAGGSGGAGGSSGGTCAGDGSCGVAPPMVAGKASSGSGDGGSSGPTQKASHDTSSGSASDSDTQTSGGGFLGWLKKLFTLDTAQSSGGSGADGDAPVGRAEGSPRGSSHGGGMGQASGGAGSSGAANSDSSADGLVPGQTKPTSPTTSGPSTSGGKSSAFAGKSSTSSADGKSSAQASSGAAGSAIENLLTSVMSGVSKLISSILSG